MRATKATRIAVLFGTVATVASCENSPAEPHLDLPLATGAVEINVRTSGEDLDADGYGIVLGDLPVQSVATDGQLVVRDLAAGTYRLQVESIATNCVVVGGDELFPVVAPGTTTTVQISILCTRLPGSGSDFACAATCYYDRVTPSFIPGTQRYVLHADGRFGLRYDRPDWGAFEYTGTYTRDGSRITFEFDAWNLAGPWLADGTIYDRSLVIRYNIVMSLADFEDGLFARSPEAP